ncbi:MAG: carboxylesterase family protein [Chloroflexota bacterium]|nr:MAG: carboxylesterase family protein [Chloroflexota bacterium]
MKRFMSFLLITVVLLSTVAVSCAPASVPLTDPIKIDTGLVSGATVDDIHVYKGIPFAAPPVGDLRWKPPQPAASWEGVKKCTEFGPAPMGYYSASFPSYSQPDEDCLYLNVWTPAETTGDKLPVMVWIYGGAFWFGEGSNPGYDGVNLAKHGVILVTFNYRLGPLGFLAHPLLSKESEHNSSSNYGLLDQIAALQWVQENIAAFGGDPNQVTIFGQSAGATSVICLVASPLAKGLFQCAIPESMAEIAWADIRENKYGTEPIEKMGEQLAKDLGCDTAADPIACMRAKSAQEVMDVGKPGADLFGPSVYRYGPCVDGWVIPDLPLNIFEAGKQNNVSLLIGSMADEGRLFSAVASANLDSYKNLVDRLCGDKAQQVLTMFPASDDAQARASANQVVGLMTFTCPARAYASAMSKVNSKVYFYQFTRVPPGSKMGAFHALDINYVFANFMPIMSSLKAEQYFDEIDRALAETIMSYWTNFAATGNPNKEGLPEWPAWDVKEGKYMDFGTVTEVKSNLSAEACDLFMNIIKSRRGQ